MADLKSNNDELIEELEHSTTLEPVTTMGTVKLTDGVIVYIPAPTADPQGWISSICFDQLLELTMFRSTEHADLAEMGRPYHHLML